jgi:hypothetical protein
MRPLTAALIAVLLAACSGSSGPTIPKDATIALDREPVVLPNAYVGTEQTETLQVINQGRGSLTVTAVKLQASDGGTLALIDGGGVFSAPQFSDALPATVAALSSGFVSFTYKPNKKGTSTASLVIESNAPARPELTTSVSACAVAVDGGDLDGGC